MVLICNKPDTQNEYQGPGPEFPTNPRREGFNKVAHVPIVAPAPIGKGKSALILPKVGRAGVRHGNARHILLHWMFVRPMILATVWCHCKNRKNVQIVFLGLRCLMVEMAIRLRLILTICVNQSIDYTSTVQPQQRPG